MARIDFVAAWLKIFYSGYQNNNDETVLYGSIDFFPFFVPKVISENWKTKISFLLSYN